MSADRTPVARLTGVTKRFPGVLAVDSVDLEILPGEVHVVAGENGAGKSTLMKLLSQVERPDEGTIEIAGKEATFHGPGHAQRLGIEVIYQEFRQNLFPHLSVAENRSTCWTANGALRRAGWSPRSGWPNARGPCWPGSGVDIDVRRAGSVSLSVAGAADRGDRQGVRRRRRARDPGRADRRLGGAGDRGELFARDRDLRGHGVEVIYISHRLDEIFARRRPRHGAPRRQVVEDVPARARSRRRSCSLMVGRDLADFYPKVQAEPGEVRLEVRGVGARASCQDPASRSRRRDPRPRRAGRLRADRARPRDLRRRAARRGRPIQLDGEIVRIRLARATRSRAASATCPKTARSSGLVLELAVHDNITLADLRRARAGSLALRASARTPTTPPQAAQRPGRRRSSAASRRCPAATSRRWCSPSGWRPAPGC